MPQLLSSGRTEYVKHYLVKRHEIVEKHGNRPFVPTRIYPMRRGESVGTSIPWSNYISQVIPEVDWVHLLSSIKEEGYYIVTFRGAIQLDQLLYTVGSAIRKFETPVRHYLLPREKLTSEVIESLEALPRIPPDEFSRVP